MTLAAKVRNFFRENSWTRVQGLTMLLLAFGDMLSGSLSSTPAPFFPDVAKAKGASVAEYGKVFGALDLTVCIMSPVFGAMLSTVKPMRMLMGGLLTTGISCMLFSFLEFIEDKDSFIWSSVLVRILEGCGEAAFETASYTIIAMVMPDSLSTSVGTLETMNGIGHFLGPVLGAILYSIGGYRWPFYGNSILLFAAATAVFFYAPELPENTVEKGKKVTLGSTVRDSLKVFELLKIPIISITAYSIVCTTTGVGFITGYLTDHLENFKLTKLVVGIIFMFSGFVFTAMSRVWGWICDETSLSHKFVTFLGAVFIILGLVFFGPLPSFPFKLSIPLVCVALALFGIGHAATIAAAYPLILNGATSNNYPDTQATYGLVSGLITSMSAFGYFIGPTIGGYGIEGIGYGWTCVLLIAAFLILILVLSVNFMQHRFCTTATNKNHGTRKCKEVEDLELSQTIVIN